jgi:uncharacterized membrane protein YdjX (TVP38/TMEM64 family)
MTTSRVALARVETGLRWIAAGLVAVNAWLLFRALPREALQTALREQVEAWGVWGPVLFAIVYAVATVLLIPGSWLTLLAGAVFGLSVGFAVVSCGSTAGAAAAFLIARYFARGRVQAFVDRSPRFAALDQAIQEGGWKVVALLRLSPAIPFNIQNYLYGVTRLRFLPCVLTSWIAMMPGTLLYVSLGHAVGSAAAGRSRSPAEWGLLAVGMLTTIAVTVLLSRLAKRQLAARAGAAQDTSQPLEKESQRQQSPARMAVLVFGVVLLLIAAVALDRHRESIGRSIETRVRNALPKTPRDMVPREPISSD